MKTRYVNAQVYRGGRFAAGSLLVEDGRMAADTPGTTADRTVDLGGRHAVPGLVDVHVHLREPGFPHKETIATGTAAAARGGYTTVCAMPNLNPAPDTPEHLRVQTDLIGRDAVVRVVPYASITMGQRGCGELVDFAALAPHVAGFSDDGRGVQSAGLMEEAMRRAAAVGRPIVAHCEVDDLLRGGYIHDGGYCREHGHKGICSESEWRQVERDIMLAEKTGCQYHVCHVSTRESVELVRQAKARGLRVSCETAPHYLLLCDEDLQEDGRFKMNPPLRSRADRDALVAGIADGTIEVIATDHAPHTAEEKSRGLAGSAMVGACGDLGDSLSQPAADSSLREGAFGGGQWYEVSTPWALPPEPCGHLSMHTALRTVIVLRLHRIVNFCIAGRANSQGLAVPFAHKDFPLVLPCKVF